MSKQSNAEYLELINKRRSLLPRLDAGDELHREAAAEMRRIQKQYNDDMRAEQRAAADSFQEGRWAEREANDDRY